MTAEEQLLRIAKMFGFESVWLDTRPGFGGQWVAERAAPGNSDERDLYPLEELVRNALSRQGGIS